MSTDSMVVKSAVHMHDFDKFCPSVPCSTSWLCVFVAW